jgi:hypothetical protein
VGVVKASPVAWNAAQSITTTNYATNYIYMTSAGVIGKTTSANEATYADNVVLYQVYSDGTNSIVCKENHPYKFQTAVSHAWHRLFGTLLEGTGAIVNRLSQANRTIELLGADVLTDHGLDTTIPDSTGVAVTWTIPYTDSSGRMVFRAAGPTTQLPGVFNNTTTGTLDNTGSFVVYRLGVLKDSLKVSTPTFIALPHTAVFGNISAARTAINSNSSNALTAALF